MITVISALVGAAWGGYQAKRRKGNGKDIAQYAVAYGIAFGVIGLFVGIFIERSLS